MNHEYQIANSILWAAAIIASAILHAPVALTLVVLPCLAVGSLQVARRQRTQGASKCGAFLAR